jgi:hypothetical protein
MRFIQQLRDATTEKLLGEWERGRGVFYAVCTEAI